MTQPTLLPIVFQRQIASPLDVDTVFSNTFNRNAYLTSPRRYAGQIVSDLEANAIFVLDSTRTTWLSAGSGGSGSSTLHGLTDVNVTEGVGIDGQYLKYDNATGKWVANTVSATVNTGNITFNNTTISTSLTGANINLLNSTGNTNIIGTSPDYPYAIMTSITVNSSGLFVAIGDEFSNFYLGHTSTTDGSTWSALTFNVTPRLPAQVNITAGNNTWQFTKSGNISLPLNTSSINYPNGYPYGGVSTLSALTDVNVAESAGIDGQYLKYDNATSKWIANTVLATHPIAFFFTTTPGANETLLIYNTVSNIDIQTNFNGFQCSVGTPPSGTFVLSIYKNTTQIGTITIFSNGYSQGSTSDSTVFVPGDTLLANVSISDAAIQNVGITFKGITA